ncbi:MAG: hypothetical protein AAFP76_01105 [Bacteroidota bacterium]
MQPNSTHWSAEDLKAYLLIYGAHANFRESSEEVQLIQSKISQDCYTKMHAEWKEDNDYQSVEKIRMAANQLGYGASEKEQLLNELQALFQSDGHFDILERNMFKGIRRILIA